MDLRGELAALIARARESGKFEELSCAWRELTTGDPSAERSPPDASTPAPVTYGMIGDSPAMKTLFGLIEKVAPSDVSVLVIGETGSGKELVARALHENSRRRGRVFLAENCAAVAPNLLESELFGHARGSFTGAVAERVGHFVAADGGTLFLDEIGDMPLEMQSKLLRVLQDGELRPVGSNKLRKVDVRVVAATHRDLQAMCAEGGFRQDLYYRLNVITIPLPPLREREGDVQKLVRSFVTRCAEQTGKTLGVEPEAMAALVAWSWPGNVRELENEIQRAVVFSDTSIALGDLSPRIAEAASGH